MGHVAGRGRYATETYPETGSPGAAAVAALRNRNVAISSLTGPFTPDTGGVGSLIAAILFTPRVSGVLQVSSTIQLANGATSDTYASAMQVFEGTGLSVTGGENTVDGWVMGSNTPPIVGGVGSVTELPGADITTITGGGTGALVTFGITPTPLAVGVPVILQLGLAESGGAHDLAGLVIFNISVLELP